MEDPQDNATIEDWKRLALYAVLPTGGFFKFRFALGLYVCHLIFKGGHLNLHKRPNRALVFNNAYLL